jgi:hypothetical protein
MDHRRHASYDRRCSPIFFDDSSYDGLLMADFDDHQRPSSDSAMFTIS